MFRPTHIILRKPFVVEVAGVNTTFAQASTHGEQGNDRRSSGNVSIISYGQARLRGRPSAEQHRSQESGYPPLIHAPFAQGHQRALSA
jgi:hypothetical protein